jgi:hypothetical protein
MFMPGIQPNSTWARDVLMCTKPNNTETLGSKLSKMRVPWGEEIHVCGNSGIVHAGFQATLRTYSNEK